MISIFVKFQIKYLSLKTKKINKILLTYFKNNVNLKF